MAKAQGNWHVRLRWSQPLEIDAVVPAFSEAQAIYRAWRFHRDDAYLLDDPGRWDHAVAKELSEPKLEEERDG
jgi:hypothetical protein